MKYAIERYDVFKEEWVLCKEYPTFDKAVNDWNKCKDIDGYRLETINMSDETMIVLAELMELFDNNREETEAFMNETDHEDYTLEERRYDEGYTNALLWASLTIGKMMFGKE